MHYSADSPLYLFNFPEFVFRFSFLRLSIFLGVFHFNQLEPLRYENKTSISASPETDRIRKLNFNFIQFYFNLKTPSQVTPHSFVFHRELSKIEEIWSFFMPTGGRLFDEFVVNNAIDEIILKIPPNYFFAIIRVLLFVISRKTRHLKIGFSSVFSEITPEMVFRRFF